MTTKQVGDSGRPKPPAAGKGRPKGSANKTTRQVKEMILTALDKAGGAEYLLRQASANPTAFMTLVGKVLPLQVAGDSENPLVLKMIERKIVHSDNRDP